MNDIAETDDLLLLLGLSGSPTSEEYQIASFCLRSAESSVRRFLHYDPTQATRTEYYPVMDFTQQQTGVWEVDDNEAYIRRISQYASDELQIRHLPIRSVTNLYVDYDGRFGQRSGAFAADTEWTEGSDFWPQYDVVDSSSNPMCRDGIIRSEGRWPDSPGSVKIIYVSGYTTAELAGTDSVVDARPIYDTVIDEATRKFYRVMSRKKSTLAGFAGPFSSESLGDYSYSADSAVRASIIQGNADLSADNMDRIRQFVNLGVLLAS